jgi:hypothetical protein
MSHDMSSQVNKCSVIAARRSQRVCTDKLYVRVADAALPERAKVLVTRSLHDKSRLSLDNVQATYGLRQPLLPDGFHFSPLQLDELITHVTDALSTSTQSEVSK